MGWLARTHSNKKNEIPHHGGGHGMFAAAVTATASMQRPQE